MAGQEFKGMVPPLMTVPNFDQRRVNHGLEQFNIFYWYRYAIHIHTNFSNDHAQQRNALSPTMAYKCENSISLTSQKKLQEEQSSDSAR